MNQKNHTFVIGAWITLALLAWMIGICWDRINRVSIPDLQMQPLAVAIFKSPEQAKALMHQVFLCDPMLEKQALVMLHRPAFDALSKMISIKPEDFQSMNLPWIQVWYARQAQHASGLSSTLSTLHQSWSYIAPQINKEKSFADIDSTWASESEIFLCLLGWIWCWVYWASIRSMQTKISIYGSVFLVISLMIIMQWVRSESWNPIDTPIISMAFFSIFLSLCRRIQQHWHDASYRF